jgi:peptidoglycan/LPS O-acetylase OafA/YrhL
LSGKTRGGLRVDIQGLRAVAVTMVVVYHLFPSRLHGGFVGVDVFFVISGFLITSHLVSQAPRTGGDLLAFWGRRIRRLLPASLLVLAVTMVGSWALLPDTRWQSTALQIRAAALYVVNWRLAHDAVDYLSQDAAASPVQHFWSLSVEEQFYLVWPILILLLGLLAYVTRRRPMLWYAVGLGAVVVLSLLWSIHETAADPAAAYFVTWTRVWELGVGGLAALLARTELLASRAVLARTFAAAIGLIGMVAVGFGYDASTPFPGWQAGVPVLAAALVILADAPRWSLPVRILGMRPVQWLGDVSYSVYLWHWPLIVLVPAARHHDRDALDNVAIIVLTLVLAAASKRWVEDGFRTAAWMQRLRPTYAMGAFGMVVVVLLSAGVIRQAQHHIEEEHVRLAAALRSHDPCLGAGATDPSKHCAPATGAPVPSPALAATDKSDAYSAVSHGKDCWSYLPSFKTVTCQFGARDATTRVALVGNSHAGQWLPALQRIAEEKHWHITTYLASQCAMADVSQTFDTTAHSDACRAWAHRTAAQVAASKPDLIVLANRVSVTAVGKTSVADSQPAYEKGIGSILRTWSDAGVPTVVIRDTPAPGDGGMGFIPDCVGAHPDDYATACSGPRSEWLPADPGVAAAKSMADPLVSTVDLTDRICPDATCQPVVGGVIVYFDASHLTATYNSTLAPYLEPALIAGLGHHG